MKKNTETVESKQEETVASVESLMKAVENEGVKVRKPQVGSIAAKQLAYFAGQDKVRYRFPRGASDPKGAFETVCVNDLLITILKGVSCDVPEDVAKILDDMQNITDAALRKDSLKDLPSDSPLRR